MVQPSHVVPETMAVGETDFLSAVVAGLARAQRKVGPKALAFVMDLTTKQLRNVLGNGSTSAKRLWDARAADPTALDDIADLYGCRIVPRDSICDTDLGTLPIAALLHKVVQAEDPRGPGGASKTHREILDMEDDIRAVHALTAAWLNEIKSIRQPRAAA